MKRVFPLWKNDEAGTSSLSQDEFEEPSTSGGLKRSKWEDVNQNVSTATENEVEMVSLNAAASDVEAENFRELTGERQGAMWDIHNYFAKFPDEMKKKAKEILMKTYESEGEKVMDLLHALEIKPIFNELPASTPTDEFFVCVELNCDIKLCEFNIIAVRSNIHNDVLDYFRRMFM